MKFIATLFNIGLVAFFSYAAYLFACKTVPYVSGDPAFFAYLGGGLLFHLVFILLGIIGIVSAIRDKGEPTDTDE